VASAIAEALGLADITALDLLRRARTACEDHPTLLMLRQFRAGVGGGTAGGGSRDVGRVASTAGHHPRAAPCARRTGVRRRTSRVGSRLGRDGAGRLVTDSGCATVRGTGSRRLPS